MVFGDNKINLPSSFTSQEAIKKILLHYNLKNGNIQKTDFEKVKSVVDSYNNGVGKLAIYIHRGPSGYALLPNRINLSNLENQGIIKKDCK